MTGKRPDVGYWFVAGSIVVLCILLPMASFIRLAFLQYDRATAGYARSPISSKEIEQVLRGPDLQMMAKLAFFSSVSALLSMIFAALILLIFAPRRNRHGLVTLVGLLTAGFFVPVVVKVYGFATFVQASTGTAMLYVGGTFMVLFLAPSLAKIHGAQHATIDATHEYFTAAQRTFYVLRAARGALLLGLLSSLSMVFYSGNELRQLATNLTPVGEIFSSMLGVRDQEVGLIAILLLILAIGGACISTLAASRLWPHKPT